jgi:DNA-binding CsgD family transcriptional regulator
MSKAQRAAEAVAANPQKSNRAIADDLGVSEGTVRTARQSTAQDYAVDDRSLASA